MRRFTNYIDRFFWGSGLADDLPALTYYILVSLLPFCLGLVVIASLVFGDQISPQTVADSVGQYFPAEAQRWINQGVNTAQNNSPLLLAVAVLAMAWTSSGAIGVIERALARMTSSRRYHPSVVGRLRNLLFGFLVAFVLVSSVAATTVASGVLHRIGWSNSIGILIKIIQACGSVGFCTLLYRYIVRDRIPWRRAFFGGLCSGLLLQIVPILGGLYFVSAAPSLPQVFLALALLVFACYLLAIAFLIGAGIAAHAGSPRVRDLWLSDHLRRAVDNGGRGARYWYSGLPNKVNGLLSQYGLQIRDVVHQPYSVGFLVEDQSGHLRCLDILPGTAYTWPTSTVLPTLYYASEGAVFYDHIDGEQENDILVPHTLEHLQQLSISLQSVADYPAPAYNWASVINNAIAKSALPSNQKQLLTQLPTIWCPGDSPWEYNSESGDIVFLRPQPAIAPQGWPLAWCLHTAQASEAEWDALGEDNPILQEWRSAIAIIAPNAQPKIQWAKEENAIVKL